MTWESYGIALLASALVRPLALAAAAWLMLRVLRVRHPASRHAVWTAVLIGMLLLPVVSMMTPHWKLPVLPPNHDAAAQAQSLGWGFESFDASRRQTRHTGDGSGLPAAETLLLWCYAAGLLAMAAHRAMGWALLRRVVSRSTPLRARLRESGDVVTPVAVGVLRPAVILPTGWRGWNASTRRAVLAHEFAHLRRHDALVLALARLVKCLFWFHPLAWWVSRKISNLAELACDAAAMERVDDPAGYSRMLLEFADRVNRAGRRVALPGLAMAAGSGMGRRVDHVFELSGGTLRKLARPRLSLALMGVPVMFLAATVGLAERHAQAQTQAQSQNGNLAGPYLKWLNEDVAYIVTDEERRTYRQLTTDSQREKFIEEFWLRRDPTPGTPRNEFKEEHYRRIAYANERFGYEAGHPPGWKTDRGRIYITYGPPDEIDSHPHGSATSAFPFEQWRYRLIEGIGKDVIIEFIATTESGDYRMTLDPGVVPKKQ